MNAEIIFNRTTVTARNTIRTPIVYWSLLLVTHFYFPNMFCNPKFCVALPNTNNTNASNSQLLPLCTLVLYSQIQFSVAINAG